MNRIFDGDHETVLKIHRQLGGLQAADRTVRKSVVVPGTPTPDQVATFIETAFWASLQRNEGRPSTFRATLAAPEAFSPGTVQLFTESATFGEQQIAKMAPAI